MRNSSTEASPPALDSRPARAVATAAARAWAVRQLQIIKDDDDDDDDDDDRSLFHNSVKETSIIKYDANGRGFFHSSVKETSIIKDDEDDDDEDISNEVSFTDL